jgi:hypothetical protein
VKGLKLLIVAASAAAALAVSLGAHAGGPKPVLEAQNAADAQSGAHPQGELSRSD